MGSSEDEDRQKWRKIASANPCNIYIGGGCRIWPNFWGDEDLMGLLEKWAWVGLMRCHIIGFTKKDILGWFIMSPYTFLSKLLHNYFWNKFAWIHNILIWFLLQKKKKILK